MNLFSLISVLISLAAVASYLNYRYIHLPTTIGVMFVALVGSLIIIVAGPYVGGFHDQAAAMMSQIDFGQTVLHCLLAFLLFAGAIHVHFDDLTREWPVISLLAIVGTLLGTAIVGVLTWLVLGWLGIGIPFMEALLFGALISPTDPIAVLAIMKSVAAPKQWEVQLSAESLFNDGLGVVIFLVMLELSGGGSASTGHGFHFSTVAILLLKEVGGALILGLVSGLVAFQMLRRVDNYQVEVLITLALAMGGYALAEALHLSAPITVVVSGVFIGNKGRAFAMSERTKDHVDTFWELIDEILNTVLFLLTGLQLLVLPHEWKWLAAGLLVVPIVVLARWISVLSTVGPLGLLRAQRRGSIAVLTWGALRGAISVALALSLPPSDARSLLLTITYCVVVFSILVQGLTISRVIKHFTHGEGPIPEGS